MVSAWVRFKLLVILYPPHPALCLKENEEEEEEEKE